MRYLLEGSMQRGRNRMRVNVQLNAIAFIAPSMDQSCATGYLLCDDYGVALPDSYLTRHMLGSLALTRQLLALL